MSLRALPRLTLALMAVPVLAGLAGTLMPAFADGATAFRDLAAWPGLPRASALSLGTGLASTAVALGLCLAILAALYGSPAFDRIRRLLAPLLAVPHAAAALGLAFLIAPSGWIARALSPWATGWTSPPDLLILNDPWGLSLTAGLIAKELPFLLLMALSSLAATDPERRLTTAASLGYGRASGFLLTILPALYRQLRLPVYAVLTYAMTVVDMALILGPTLPPTLSQQVVNWQMAPSLTSQNLAAAGAVLQLALVLFALTLWRMAEIAARALLIRWAMSGHRAAALDRPVRRFALFAATLLAGALFAGLAAQALWSVAADWRFSDALPASLSLAAWRTALPDLAPATARTIAIAVAATLAALALALGCLEAEARHGLRATPRAMMLLYLPLLVPQVVFLPGLQTLALAAKLEGNWIAVAAAHVVFVLPYVFLSLSQPFRNLDPRLAIAARALGATEARIFWQMRLPLLLAPVLTAFAVGMAVSVGLYLPTLLLGGGRVTTLTTEAVALSSGGNRRIIGSFALLQLLLPALCFWIALALPRIVWRHRRRMLA
ncbi:ABC transporter permease [Paragemmobacter straminiformis]|uniref:ABC transporter permease subunit n=1 Tax=Paragemmobacter straminiformis TaxID=2045119 RepID=A0A842I714_9RHOB|nr:ABC transporter permease subunit [Gemmobacter straminiformis]MBC2835167.1 ABC transporter permease subunit [Gemmobacter straminiformis]